MSKELPDAWVEVPQVKCHVATTVYPQIEYRQYLEGGEKMMKIKKKISFPLLNWIERVMASF